MSIKALDKLKEFVGEDALLVEMIEAVEHEVDERFIELPVDAEGVPIRPGDLLEYDYPDDISGKHTIVALIYDGGRTEEDDGGIWDFEFDDDDEDTRCVGSMRDFYSCNHHVKPDYQQAAEYWQRMYEETFATKTCRNTGSDPYWFECSECKCMSSVDWWGSGLDVPHYCPNCGAKVVSE